MIDRGNCNFVDKVKRVENIGGLVALIIDNNAGEDPTRVIMSDDEMRHGENIRIPALLISKEDGTILEEFYREHKDNPKMLEKIILEIEFVMEHPSNHVSYSFIYSSENFNIYKIFRELRHFTLYHSDIRNMTTFLPYFATNSVYQEGQDNKTVENCYSSGRYCASPRLDLNITDGRFILKQNLFQKCIYKFAYGKWNETVTDIGDSRTIFWNYIDAFYDNCIGNNTMAKEFNEACTARTLHQLNINTADVYACIFSSFGFHSSFPDSNIETSFTITPNKIFEADKEIIKSHKVRLIPTILINNRTFWGNWNGENVFEAICAGFRTKPQVCYDEGGFSKEVNTGMSNTTLAIIIILVISVNIVIFILCRKYIKKKISDKVEDTEINLKINTVVTSYLALKETK